MRTAPLGGAAAALAATILLSSCGVLSDDDAFLEQAPREIAKVAFKEMRQLSSMRVLGTVDDDQLGPMRVDLKIDASDACVGSLHTGRGNLDFVQNAKGAWFRGDERFLRSLSGATEQTAATLGRSWFEAGKDDDLSRLCSWRDLVGDFRVAKDDTVERIDEDEVEEVGGADAVPITGRDGKEPTTAWVSVKAPHRVLKMAPLRTTGEIEELYFEEFDLDVVARTPPRKDIVGLPRRP